MRKLISAAAILMAFSFCFLSCNNKGKGSNNGSSHDIPLGMKFEEKNKLAGIPLASTPFGGDELPKSFDLSDKMPPVGNQGSQNSCVAWAIAYAMKSYQEKVEIGQQLQFSPSYIYNQINNGMNVPTYVTDALNMMSEQGVCPYEDMPYVESDFTSKPSETAKQAAKRFRIDFWRQVNVADLKEVKAQISAGYPVIIGADVSKDFVDDGFAKKADYIWKEAGTSAGGHCMLLVGYDDSKQAFKLMNSWGKDWGDNGFGWVSYDLFPNVIKYGFVTKDAVTPGNNNDFANNNNNNENNPQNNNNNQETNTEYNTTTDVPNDNPTSFDENVDFNITNVEYDVKNPSDPEVGLNMKIHGKVDIPAVYGKKFQIVVHIYSSDTKRQVKSLIYPTYADVNGYAAGCTPQYDITSKGFRNGTWWIDIPYSAIDMPHGRKSYFYAIPTLFIDGFGVAYGDKIEFYVDNP
jgi:hypothetical protein